ncbi:MAG: succinylglutamate desuccinylase [Deltaproteobacteria bacterium]
MRKTIISALMALTLGLLVVSSAFADKLVCISNEKLKGQMTVNNCLRQGEKFAIVDQYGAVHLLTPEEAKVMRKLNPKLFEEKAYGIIYLKEAPEMPKLPPMATPKAYQ